MRGVKLLGVHYNDVVELCLPRGAGYEVATVTGHAALRSPRSPIPLKPCLSGFIYFLSSRVTSTLGEEFQGKVKNIKIMDGY